MFSFFESEFIIPRALRAVPNMGHAPLSNAQFESTPLETLSLAAVTNDPDSVPGEYLSAPKRVLCAPKRRKKFAPVKQTSWSLPVPDGAYSKVPVWNGRAKWVSQLNSALRSPEGERVRRKVSISPDTLIMIAELDAQSADSRTGRGVATSHESVGNTLGMCKRTVRRGRRVILLLGFAVVVVRGRYLTKTERTEAQAVHGGYQLRAASVRALTVPAGTFAVENVHLPRRGLRTPTSHLKVNSPKRAEARKAASRPEKSPSRKKTPQDRQTNAVPVARIASELSNRIPFLSPWRTHVREITGKPAEIQHSTEHIGSLCRIIVQSGIDTSRLTGSDVIEVLDRITAESGLTTMTGTYVKNPLGYLMTLLRRVRVYCDRETYVTTAERAEAAAARRAANIERQAAARVEEARLHSPEAIEARNSFFSAWRSRSSGAPA